MASQAINFTTPTGRLVSGNVYKLSERKKDGKTMIDPATGKPEMNSYFGLAIPKIPGQHWSQYPRLETKPGEPSWGEAIWLAAHQFVPAAGQMSQNGTFAMKITDGDSQVPNTKQKRPCDQEGWPGHWVLHFGGSFLPKTYNGDGSAMVPAESVKTGYFVQVAGSVRANDSTQKPGVYLNPGLVALRGYGPEIVSGPDAASAGFGGGALPAGASAMPPAGMMPAPPSGGMPGYAPPLQPGFPGVAGVVPGYAPPPGAAGAYVPPPGTQVAQPVLQSTTFPAPPQHPAPHPGILTPPAMQQYGQPPAMQQQAPGYAAPAMQAPPPQYTPPPAGPQVTPAANGATWAQLQANGWTEPVARQHGLIV